MKNKIRVALKSVLFSPLILFSLPSHSQQLNTSTQLLDSMRIAVPEMANRSISFTNKESAYYYTQSHQTNHQEYAWFEGMNIAKNRVFGGYNLFADGRLLSNQNAQVWVYPYKMVREHLGQISEELWMIDYKNIIEVSLTGPKQSIGIALKGKGIRYVNTIGDMAFFTPVEGKYVIAVSSKIEQSIQVQDLQVITSAKAGGFYIAVGKTNEEAIALIRETRAHNLALKSERAKRMQDLLTNKVYTTSGNDSLAVALNWLEITTDQLLTHQQGYGIYAGLPWFNEYWGRDEFISLPGAALVTGQFAVAKKILQSFAKYQQIDPASKYFGRVPNIVNPSNIDYHTTDGTPRFIIGLQDYVKYSGDVSLIKELYPNVKNSIEGALKYWVDDKGYLLHEDNETWMDARDANLVSYSPRGSRANDIQALWYKQLLAGVYFARYMKDATNEQKWQRMADKVKSNFAKDYTDANHSYLADRLTKEGKADFTLRPNQLFALDMISNTGLKGQVLSKTWQELVYPWGVATLDKHDPFFHPFHLTNDYPKDEAYHNGTIWPWLNGIAMQRMIEAEQAETAYQLFKNMNWQALNLGVVGGLGENLDAFPHKGQKWPKLTGAYLQAWSNAEQLRVWYQYFLGIRPDMTNHQLVLAPRIPAEVTDLHYNFFAGNELYKASYEGGKMQTYTYQFGPTPLTTVVDIYPYAINKLDVAPNSILQIIVADNELTLKMQNKQGKVLQQVKTTPSKTRISQDGLYQQQLEHIQFAKPDDLSNHKVIKDLLQ
ncbi:hypothetical protein HH214_09715 [Mucilaginibacter robiniae]|uniref:Glycogen debranching enzyme C-terminal domain-containing protein n=1 Tax=Mucilaginibacter robiniae TaxID=2728022 RepID=A0A7L5DYC7_9SPHI|nr:amylo-alpha-1,6-glucosidase [Mucilaginibacter robiniae]QJD96132.1 hypothetical protein HH214_09715 [Mucilaginibacter robiniae]